MDLVLLLIGIISLISGLVLTFSVGVVNVGLAGIILGIVLLWIGDRSGKAAGSH